MRDNQIDALVTKNSGGSLTYAKIVAARQLGIPVIMVHAPAATRRSRITAVHTASDAYIAAHGLMG